MGINLCVRRTNNELIDHVHEHDVRMWSRAHLVGDGVFLLFYCQPGVASLSHVRIIGEILGKFSGNRIIVRLR